MNHTKKYIGLIAGVSLLVFAGCKKEFFDINESPNSPKTLKLNEILPTTELAVGQAVGNELQISGGIWAQYWTQNWSASQYKEYEQYNISAESQRSPWGLLYSDALTDLNYIIKLANAENKPNYVAVATLLKAYNFQVLTDAYGDIPFSEAGKGEEGVLNPKYDSQKNVYDGIIAMAKEGLAKIDLNSDVHPGDDDLIYHGDMGLWQKFGNTLLLKIYLRLSNADPAKAQAGIAALSAAGAQFIDNTAPDPQDNSASEAAKINYFTTGGNTNPLYSSFVALGKTKNLIASATGVKAFLNLNDDRVTVVYTPAGATYLGVPNGYLGDLNTGGFPTPPTSVSAPGAITGGTPDESSATAPVLFISDFESYFLQAEAKERGWLTTGPSAQELYEGGIALSYTYLGLATDTTTSFEDYIADPAVDYATQTDKLQAIFFQKWFAMCGIQNFEAWTEGRRTGYIEQNMGNDITSGKFFTRSLNAGGMPLPARVLYPNSESTRNSNFPGQKPLGAKVWWAK